MLESASEGFDQTFRYTDLSARSVCLEGLDGLTGHGGPQVKRAQAHLLEHLYSAVTTLGGAEAEFLLEEESESVVKREKLKKVPALPAFQIPVKWHANGAP